VNSQSSISFPEPVGLNCQVRDKKALSHKLAATRHLADTAGRRLGYRGCGETGEAKWQALLEG
jgi:hypothetical protein